MATYTMFMNNEAQIKALQGLHTVLNTEIDKVIRQLGASKSATIVEKLESARLEVEFQLAQLMSRS